MPYTHRSSGAARTYQGKHPFQHWYRDNQVYFITARCRERYRAFATEEAKQIFWRQYEKYTADAGFTPWITTLIDNHYHTLGYLRQGTNLGPMMKGIHGATARYVNQILEYETEAGRLPVSPPLDSRGRLTPFWHDSKKKTYFDGCIRDEKQCRLAYRYTLTQSRRHGICADPRDYPHTHITVELEEAARFAIERRAYLEGVVYKRYARR